MAGRFVEVELENLTRVEKDIYYLRTTAGNMRVHGNRVIANAVNKSKKIFKDQIQHSVYDIPPTTYTRTGALGRAVRSREFSKGMGAGEIFIDPGLVGLNGYFYPASVEHGLRTERAYWARHYWAKGKVLAIREFRRDMEPFAKELAKRMINR